MLPIHCGQVWGGALVVLVTERPRPTEVPSQHAALQKETEIMVIYILPRKTLSPGDNACHLHPCFTGQSNIQEGC